MIHDFEGHDRKGMQCAAFGALCEYPYQLSSPRVFANDYHVYTIRNLRKQHNDGSSTTTNHYVQTAYPEFFLVLLFIF